MRNPEKKACEPEVGLVALIGLGSQGLDSSFRRRLGWPVRHAGRFGAAPQGEMLDVVSPRCSQQGSCS